MNDSLAQHMIPYLNLVEMIDLLQVDKRFNCMIRDRVGLRASEILRLRRILRAWKSLKRHRLPRYISWKRTIHHPDERVIF